MQLMSNCQKCMKRLFSGNWAVYLSLRRCYFRYFVIVVGNRNPLLYPKVWCGRRWMQLCHLCSICSIKPVEGWFRKMRSNVHTSFREKPAKGRCDVPRKRTKGRFCSHAFESTHWCFHFDEWQILGSCSAVKDRLKWHIRSSVSRKEKLSLVTLFATNKQFSSFWRKLPKPIGDKLPWVSTKPISSQELSTELECC